MPVFKFGGIKICCIAAIKCCSINSEDAHRTRLKEQLLSHFPGVPAAKKERCSIEF